MTTRPEIPNFGELLGPHLANVPQQSLPGFLCDLERTAAGRYRAWAEIGTPEERDVLLACSRREDEIAERVEVVLPPDAAERNEHQETLGRARETYVNIFEGRSLHEQLYIQAGAERQGAAAWRGIAAGHADAAVKRELEACAALEEENSAAVEELLGVAIGSTSAR